MIRKFFAMVFFVTISISIFSQSRDGNSRYVGIKSPEILSDKSVIFRLMAPQAKEVKLSTQFINEPKLMERDSAGMWSVKLGPVKPDIYPYCFVVDGVQVQDPNNTYYFSNEKLKNSLLDVPGNEPLIHSMQDVPHGSVVYCDYNSKTFGGYRPLVIYLPPDYEKNSRVNYPVFYLLSGTTDTEETFFKVGHTNLILDNLLSQGKDKPMIIVMPYGNPEISAPTGTSAHVSVSPTGEDIIGEDILNSIIPFVEENYRAIKSNDSRAIGGFSRGGGQTLRIGLQHPEVFSWICCYSSYIGREEFEKKFQIVYANPEQTNKRIKMLWISVGDQDPWYKQTSEFIDLLKANNINVKTMVTEGGHTWMSVKKFLVGSTPLLFR